MILGFHHHHDSNGMEEAVRKADQQETNVTELMETNEGFRNLTNNGVPRKRGHYTMYIKHLYMKYKMYMIDA